MWFTNLFGLPWIYVISDTDYKKAKLERIKDNRKLVIDRIGFLRAERDEKLELLHKQLYELNEEIDRLEDAADSVEA